MSVDQLVCDKTVMGVYIGFDKMKPNLLIYNIPDEHHDLVALFFNRGVQKEEPKEKVVQASDFMSPTGIISADSRGFFQKTDNFAERLWYWANKTNSNIIESDFHPQEVYDIHANAYLIGKVPVRQ